MDKSLTIKEIEFKQLPKYIECAWQGDPLLPFFYDKALKDKTLENMVKDTSDKIEGLLEMHEGVKMFGIDCDGEMAGFIVFNEKLNYLYSFGVRRNYRNGEVLAEVFSYIKNSIKEFFCLMNKYNDRAIAWLKKCGMVEYPKLSPQDDITYLKYNICQ